MQHHLSVTRTARYITAGTISAELQEVWFVCHGQGQLAEYFIKPFQSLTDDGRRLIVAPEALSRFYLDPVQQRVGAIWMTREDRLNEIQDYINYLNTLYEHIFSQIDRQTVKVTVLGFSQGVATVGRWLNAGKAQADRLIIWAGQIPAELDEHGNWPIFQKLDLQVVVGNEDEYVTAEFVDAQLAILRRHNIEPKLTTFEGTHRLSVEVLKQLANNS